MANGGVLKPTHLFPISVRVSRVYGLSSLASSLLTTARITRGCLFHLATLLLSARGPAIGQAAVVPSARLCARQPARPRGHTASARSTRATTEGFERPSRVPVSQQRHKNCAGGSSPNACRRAEGI